MNEKFWEIKAKKGAKTADLLVYGPISRVQWWGDEVTAKEFKKDLDKLEGTVETLNLYINSEGGDVFAAQAIYSMLKRHKATVHTYVDGLAASAASLIAMAGETVTMPKNAMMMIHNPWAFVIGNSTDMRKRADDLDQIRKSMIAVYEAKADKTEEEIIDYLDAETWFTAEEAVEAGFADEVEEEKEVAASLKNDTTFVINGREVDIEQFRKFPKDRIPPAAQAGPTEDELAAERERQARLRLLRAKLRL